MLPEIETLLIIQDRDQKILNMERDLVNLPKLIEHAESRLSGDKEELARGKAEIQANEVLIKNLDLDVETRRNTIARLKHQQFETRKNEEYQALGHEVQRYENEVGALEDQELELMERAEALKEKLTEAKAGLERTQVLIDDELAQLAERKANGEAEIENLRTERDTYTPKVGEDLLGIYDRLFTSKGGSAIVALSGGQCKGCHMKVTSALALKVRSAQEVTHCVQCGRILYFED